MAVNKTLVDSQANVISPVVPVHIISREQADKNKEPLCTYERESGNTKSELILHP